MIFTGNVICVMNEKKWIVFCWAARKLRHMIYDKLLMAFKITELLRLRKKFPWINITCADLEGGGGSGDSDPSPLKIQIY